MSKKYKCVVSESLLKEFEFLKRGVNEHSAFCSLCQTSFTVASGGRTSVSEHVATKRCRRAVVTQSRNTKVSTFFKSIVPDKNDMAIALQVGTFAFHTVQHHQSFKSMDCPFGLIKKFFEPKFTCSRTEVEAVIKHVISPWAYEEVTEEIKTKTSFVTVLIDASNHGHVKYCLF
jgi:hypothetical protein